MRPLALLLLAVAVAVAVAPAAAQPTTGEPIVRTIPLRVNDLAYDPGRGLLYGTVAASFSERYGNSVVAIDPVLGVVTDSLALGVAPDALALSDDGSALYVAAVGDDFRGVLRIDVAAWVVVDQFGVGRDTFDRPNSVRDVVVQPGNPSVVAVSVLDGYTGGELGVAIYEDGVRRLGALDDEDPSRLLAFSGPDRLYGFNDRTTEFGFRRYAVGADGADLLSVDTGFVTRFGVREFEVDEGLVYVNERVVIDGEARRVARTFPEPAIPSQRPGHRGVEHFSGLGRTADYGRTLYLVASAGSKSLVAYDDSLALQIGYDPLPVRTDVTSGLVRWGPSGLAYATYDEVVLVESALLSEQVAGAHLSVSEISLGDVEGVVERPVTLTNPGTSPLRVDRAVAGAPGLSFQPASFVAGPGESFVVGPGESIEGVVRFEPTKTGRFSSPLTFEGNAYNAATVTVSGNVVVPILEYSPAVVDFSRREVGRDHVAQVYVENPSCRDVEVGAVSVTGGPFRVDAGTFTLGCRESRAIEVEFAPERVRAFEALLVVSSDAYVPSDTLVLRGLAVQTTLYPGLSGDTLRAAIRADFTPTRTLGYGPARDSLYAYEQRRGGALCGVYTGYCVQLDPARDPSTDAFEKGINAEHTWPQSRGAESEPARSDLHALFPAKDNVNSSRGNHPYAEIPDAETDVWYREDEALTTPPPFINEWSEKDNEYPSPPPGTDYSGRFEPRWSVSGDIARAIAYFAVIYEAEVDAYGEREFLTTMLDDLLAWNAGDSSFGREVERSDWIATLQGTENPFVLEPSLMERAFFGYGESSGEPATLGALWVNEFHYDNDGTDTGEFVEVAGRAGTDLSGWRLVLYNGTGGAVYDERALAGEIDDEDNGLGAVAFEYPSNGIQNGPDAVALVDPSGQTVQFVSYEGVVVAVGGPADGMASEDIAVEENGSTPVGQSIGLRGTGGSYANFVWASLSTATPGMLNVDQAWGTSPNTGDGPGAELVEVSVYPNPVRGRATIELTPNRSTELRVVVYDVLGRAVRELYDGRAPEGRALTIPLDGSELAPGLYVLRLEGPEWGLSQTIVVLR